MANLKREMVLEQWGAIVEGGAGKDQWMIDKTEQKINEHNPPGVSCRRETVSSGLFGEKRDFLIVTHQALREYAVFISARNYGRDLEVSAYLTVNPGFLKRAISKQIAMGNPNALSMNLDLFAQQDLGAYKSVVFSVVKATADELVEELKLEPSTIGGQSKGFLSVW